MRVICKGLDLSEAVLKVVKACAVKTTKPILEAVKITSKNDGMTLVCTDEEILISKTIKADVLEEGEIAVPAKYFADFAKKLENQEILIFDENNKLAIKYGESESSIQLMNVKEFPSVNTAISENNFVVSKKDFKTVINRTSFCCAIDEARPLFKGCHLEICNGKLYSTALDGYRLAFAGVTCKESTGVFELTCPARTLNEIVRMLDDEGDITVYTQNNMFMVNIDDMVITSRLYIGKFISREPIIPTEFSTKAIINKENLQDSVERAAILARTDKHSLINLNFTDGMLEVNSNSIIGRVNESLKIELTGKDMTIAVNSKYLYDSLKCIDDEIAIINCNEANAPIVITPCADASYLYLILPVKTNQQ